MIEPENKDLKTIQWHKKVLMKSYALWEGAYHHLTRLKQIDERDLLLYRFRKYSGHPIEFEDGTILKKGDPILELHFNNQLLIHTAGHSKNTMHMITTLLHMLKETLNRLRGELEKPEYDGIKGLYGISLFHRGAKQVGFEVMDLPGGFGATYHRLYLKTILTIMHPNGLNRVKGKSNFLSPKIIAASKDNFIKQKSQ